MKRTCLVLALALSAPALADHVPKPEKAATCAACHGDTGISPQPTLYPSLAGQYANYLEHAMKEYRAGLRKNLIMGAQATSLTDAEIEQLSTYFAEQQGPLVTPTIHGR